MILVDHMIKDRVSRGELNIGNFDPGLVQPASYDLRLGHLIHSPTQPDRAIDLSNGAGGAWRLPPYGMAVVQTFEDLKLPKNVIGRIGLKSSFARTGLFASTGPQIDPGFDGRLFVSLFNLTAAPHVLKFRDTFLTIEFHELDQEPDRGYEGPYQGKHSIGPEVLESLVRLEGLTLSQMQSQFTELAKHVEQWRDLASRFDEFLSTMNAATSAIRELALTNSPTLEMTEGLQARIVESPLPTRRLTVQQAADEVLVLFRRKKTLYYSDIAEELSLDLKTVIKACALLEKRGLIEGVSRESKRAKKSRR
jgi:dCTP deaminase